MNNLENFNGDKLIDVNAIQSFKRVGYFIQDSLVVKSARKQPLYQPATVEIRKQFALANTVLVNQVLQIAQLKFGHHEDQKNDFGPLISQAHNDKVQAFIQSAEHQGAKIVVDGRDTKPIGYKTGFFVDSTLIDQVSSDMTSYQQEIFDPVLQVIRIETMQQAMQLINDHEYGDGICIYTRDGYAFGPNGVHFYTRRKTITPCWPSSHVCEAKLFSMPTLN